MGSLCEFFVHYWFMIRLRVVPLFPLFFTVKVKILKTGITESHSFSDLSLKFCKEAHCCYVLDSFPTF